MNRHVSESNLALFSGNDLPRWRAYLVKRHAGRCPDCARSAAAYRESRHALRGMADTELLAPTGLAERIIAQAAAQPNAEAAEASGAWRGAVRRFAPAGAMLALAAAAALMIVWPAPAPAPLSSTLALATRDSLVGEARNALRRERMEIDTRTRGGVAEVSATGSGVAVTQADPATGAVRISRLVMEE